MDVAGVIKSVPELLKVGVEIYDTLKTDMQQALGLCQYAEHLSHVIQILKEASKFLDQKEQDLAEKLDKAYSLSRKGLDKATVVVSVIRAQSDLLTTVLSESALETDQMKIWAACKYFTTFANTIIAEVKEAKDALLEASITLQSRQNDISGIVTTLKKVQNQFLFELKAAIANQKAVTYKGALVGLVLGPLGLIISFSVAAAINKFHTIPKIEEDFQMQQKKFSEYIDEFNKMQSETSDLQKRLDTKHQELTAVYSRLRTASNLTGIDDAVLRSMPTMLLRHIRTAVDKLVKSCDEFLKTTATL